MAHEELRPFAPGEAETVAAWAASPDDREHLIGTRAPLSADDVALWMIEASGSFTLRRDGDLVAYGEIIEDEVEGDVEIQHLLVAPDNRGAGVGRAMLVHLCDFLRVSRTYPEVWLRVGRGSIIALNCARSAGFMDVPQMSGPRYLWLKNTLDRSSVSAPGGDDYDSF